MDAYLSRFCIYSYMRSRLHNHIYCVVESCNRRPKRAGNVPSRDGDL